MHCFGGEWTKVKLSIVSRYLGFYTKALKKQKVRKVYIDAFAGTGDIMTGDGVLIEGSARRALEIEIPFDEYIFIELNNKRVAQLVKLKALYPEHSITVLHGDANKHLCELAKGRKWQYYRGVIFLDPYGLELNWNTLKELANVKVFDIWYLFSYSGMNRLLKKDGSLINSWEEKLDVFLGNRDWKDKFYKENPQVSLFDDDDFIKCSSIESVHEYILKRFKTLFPYVSETPVLLENSKNSPMFLLYFMITNDSPTAIGLAKRVSKEIISNTNL